MSGAALERRLAEACPGWAVVGTTIERTFTFPSYAECLGFAVAVGVLAERRDHHPDLHVHWGRVRVVWWTHDAGGVTELDLAVAAETTQLGPRTAA